MQARLKAQKQAADAKRRLESERPRAARERGREREDLRPQPAQPARPEPATSSALVVSKEESPAVSCKGRGTAGTSPGNILALGRSDPMARRFSAGPATPGCTSAALTTTTLRSTVTRSATSDGSTERRKSGMDLAQPGAERMPCAESLKQIFSHFYDRLTLAGERPVVTDSIAAQSYRCQVLLGLLDEAEAKSKGRLRDVAFPASEAAAQLARLRAQEKQLLEA
ncbi:unnamed protein product, partial [Effrenium voratum]